MKAMPGISEAKWRQQVEQLADYYNWLRHGAAEDAAADFGDGFPTLILVRAVPRPQLIAAVLRRDGEQITAKQATWLAGFDVLAGWIGSDVFSARVWRPSDFDEVHEVLKP